MVLELANFVLPEDLMGLEVEDVSELSLEDVRIEVRELFIGLVCKEAWIFATLPLELPVSLSLSFRPNGSNFVFVDFLELLDELSFFEDLISFWFLFSAAFFLSNSASHKDELSKELSFPTSWSMSLVCSLHGSMNEFVMTGSSHDQVNRDILKMDLKNGIDIVTKATEHDKQDRHKEALYLYNLALVLLRKALPSTVHFICITNKNRRTE